MTDTEPKWQQPSQLLQFFILSTSIGLLLRYSHLLQSALSWILDLWLTTSKKLTAVHGSKQLPTLPYIWPNGQGNLAKFIHGRENSKAWREKYGNVYQIWSGMKPEIVLTRPEDVHAVFKDSHNHTKAIDNNSGYVLNRLLGSCLGLVSGSQWQKIHAVFQPYFTQASSQGYLETISRRTKAHVDTLHQRVQSGEIHQFDTVADFKTLPFSIIAEILYGPLPDHLNDQLTALIPLRERVFTYAISGGITRFKSLSWLPLRPLRELHEFEKRWSAFNDAVYEYQSSNLPEEAPPPVVSLYHAMYENVLTRAQTLQTIDEILFANIDVTMGAVSWCLIFLANFPDVRRKLRAEIRRRCRHQTSTDPSLDDLSAYLKDSKTYLSAFVHESSRHRPLAAFSIPQSAPTPRTFSSFPAAAAAASSKHTDTDTYTVPAGTDYIVDSHSLNIRNTAYWGPDTNIFRPERFLEKWGVVAAAADDDNNKPASASPSGRSRSADLRYNYWRFGFGPRQCLGKFVADLMVRRLLVEVVVRFDLHVDGGVKGSGEKGGTGEQESSSSGGGGVSKDGGVDGGEREYTGWDRDMESWILQPTTKIGCRAKEGTEGED